METKEVFAKRLKQARQRAGLSMEGLSAKTGKEVTKQTISKYEAGKAMAGSQILIKLSKALGVPVDYFFRPYTFDVSEVEISFRKKASIGVKDQTILKLKIQDEVERFIDIENILGINDIASLRTDTNLSTNADDNACKRGQTNLWLRDFANSECQESSYGTWCEGV